MKIIKTKPESDGRYCPIIDVHTHAAPEGWYVVPDSICTSAMQTHAGFVTLTVSDGVVTAITGDDAAYKAWKDAQPAPKEPEPDPVAVLAETVANLMYQMDVEKLNGGNTK